jgi:nitroreductase
MNAAELSDLIRRRRSVFPQFYAPDRPVERGLIEMLLENANWAPTHKRTEPWRFHVFHSDESRERLGTFLAEGYRRATTPETFSEEKFKKTLNNPRRSGAVIALCVWHDAAARLPEFEEVAAVACAVQNMWLTCTALGLGSYWSTPGPIIGRPEILDLPDDQRCLGLFYLGWHTMPDVPGKRASVAEKTQWL